MGGYSLDECMLNPFEVTRQEAQQELKRHDADWFVFVEECGDRKEYWSNEVLGWLGY
jgi:hypothetical protein